MEGVDISKELTSSRKDEQMNMSYCRFRNTLSDLDDCYDALMEKGVVGVKADADPDEQRAVTRLIKMCKQLAEDYYETREDRGV